MDEICRTKSDVRNSYKILIGKPEGKRSLGRRSILLKLILGRMWIVSVSGYGLVTGSCEHGNEPSGFIKDG
jgi:hypothetical protein